VPKLLDTRTAMRREIEGMERDVLLRQKELERADVDLGRHLVYWKHTDLLGGIATPGNESANIKGEQKKLKEHRLAMARFSLEESGRRLEALKAEYQSDQRQSFPALDKAIASRNTELQVVNQKISEQDALFQKDRTALAEKLDALKAETDKFGKEQATERSRRLTRVTQLEDRIRQLLELDLKWLTEIETVGNILSVEDRTSRAIIDLGQSERAFPGLIFEVFTYDKGTYVEKGMLEVIEVKAGISVCRILSQKDRRMHPLAKDDRIGNPTFNPRRPKTFVVAGEFERYNKADIEAFIKRSGGIVQQKLGPGVDFLVAGGRSDRDQASAREYQILGMKEDQLLKYVLPLFAPK
jgi:NAD-dependent DNA ligase